MKHLLIVDDDVGSRESLRTIFCRDYEISLADSAAKALRTLAERPVDLLLLDVVMPEKDGLTFLREIHDAYPTVPVVMVSASTAARPIVEAMKAGALDFVTKPFDVAEIRRIVERAIENSALRRQVETLQSDLAREFPVEAIVGRAPAIRRALDDAAKAAETDATVLLYGESGTGKELAARLIHARSRRRDEPFVAVHCAALPETLMESELFGYEKGAFTNATARRLGRFDLAGSGTLFFDEVGEMSPATQVKLLRVLQEREYMRVGGDKPIRTNARIIAATARDLAAEVAAHRFRDDLYYRLNVVPIRLPPLRERREDIPLLLDHFLEFFRRRIAASTRGFSPDAKARFAAYDWPGNIRELRNIVERLLVLHGHEKEIGADALPPEFHEGMPAPPPRLSSAHVQSLAKAVMAYEKQLVTEALEEAGGVQTRAAERLGTTRRILKYRMDKLGIKATPRARS